MLRARLLSVLALAFSSAVFGSACSDDDPSPGEEFIDDYCNMMMTCCSKAEKSSDPSNCKRLLTAISIGASYNESKGNQCLAAMRAASSDTLCSTGDDALDAACDDVFTSPPNSGPIQPGGKCEFDSDCASSSQGEGNCYYYWEDDVAYQVCVILANGQADSSPCVATRSGDLTVYSSSEAPPNVGYVCDEADGLYCNSESQKCVAMGQVGAACSTYERCVDEAYCDFSTRECAAKVPAGSPCTSTYGGECVDTAYCNADTMQCTQRLADGAACTSSSQCLSKSCMNDKCDSSYSAPFLICSE